MSAVAAIDRIADRIERIAQHTVTILLAAMLTTVLAGVFTRNIHISITWLEELSRYFQIWFVSIGISLSLRRGELAGTELLVKALPPGLRKIVLIFTKCVMLGFSLIMLYYGQQLLGHLIRSGQLSPNLQIPIYLAYLGIYVGFILILFFLLVSLLHNFCSQEDALDKNLLTVAPVQILEEE